MGYDREEWEKSQKERATFLELQKRVAHLRVARQAAVTAEKLTGDPHWNAFLQMLQAEIEDLRAKASAEREKAMGNRPLDTAEREMHRIEALVCEAVAGTLERVQGFPAELLRQGREADQLLLQVEGAA